MIEFSKKILRWAGIFSWAACLVACSDDGGTSASEALASSSSIFERYCSAEILPSSSSFTPITSSGNVLPKSSSGMFPLLSSDALPLSSSEGQEPASSSEAQASLPESSSAIRPPQESSSSHKVPPPEFSSSSVTPHPPNSSHSTSWKYKPGDYILGADISRFQEYEAAGYKIYDTDGKEKSIFEILRNHGVNYIRLNVFVNPESS